MSPLHRSLRFRLPGSSAPVWPDALLQLEVCVDESPIPAGYIVQLPAAQGAPVRWSYVLANGTPTGLQSTLSRREIETQIHDLYFRAWEADVRRSA